MSPWSRRLRRWAGEWERLVLAALATVAAIAMLTVGVRGLTFAGSATGDVGKIRTCREPFHAGAFAFLNSESSLPAADPFAGRPTAAVDKPTPKGKGGAGDQEDPQGPAPAPATTPAPAVRTSVFYNGCLRTGTGAELAVLTIRQGAAKTLAILPAAQAAAAGCQVVRFDRAAIVIQVGTRELEIPQGAQAELP